MKSFLRFIIQTHCGKYVRLRSHLLRRNRDHANSEVDDWIRMVATNRLTGHSAGFFSVYTLPPNQALTPKRQQKINEMRQQIPPRRSVPDLIIRKTESLLRNRQRI